MPGAVRYISWGAGTCIYLQSEVYWALIPILLTRFFIFLLFLSGTHVCFAQKDTILLDNIFCLKTSPLAFIDPWGGYSYRIGAEFKIIDNTAFSIELGEYHGFGNKLDLKIHPQGYIIRPEFKVYTNRYRLSTGPYISLDFFYKKINFDFQDSIRLPSSPTFQKQYTIWKDIYSINGRIGFLNVHKKNFMLEWYFGAGVRIISGHNSLSSTENDNVLTGENHGDLIGDGQRLIHGIWPNLTIGLKIGYSFRNKQAFVMVAKS